MRSHITLLESDLFDKVSARFDLIIFDPPFRWFKPRSMQERATTDENYTTLSTFFKQVKSRLRPGGRILLFFGTSDDINYLLHLIAQAGLKKRIVANKEITKDG
jgi:release factor glutamine methyltransferase